VNDDWEPPRGGWGLLLIIMIGGWALIFWIWNILKEVLR
jgi:hypothetical protein